VTLGPLVVTLGPLVVTPGPQVVTLGPQVVTPGPLVVTLGPLVVTPGPLVVTLGPLVVTPGPLLVTPEFVDETRVMGVTERTAGTGVAMRVPIAVRSMASRRGAYPPLSPRAYSTSRPV
jgi:hypothetical protein